MEAHTLGRVFRAVNFHQDVTPLKVHSSSRAVYKRRIGPIVVIDMDKVVPSCYIL